MTRRSSFSTSQVRVNRNASTSVEWAGRAEQGFFGLAAGIIEGAAHGRGRGREVIAVARSSDLVLMVLDGGKEQVNNHRAILERQVQGTDTTLLLSQKPRAVLTL